MELEDEALQGLEVLARCRWEGGGAATAAIFKQGGMGSNPCHGIPKGARNKARILAIPGR